MSDAYCYLYDLYPTLCDLSKIKAPATVKGISLAQTIQNPKVKKRKDILLTYINLQRAIKKDGFKLILYNVDGQRHPQLFDLKADPMEMNNLYDNSKYSKNVKNLLNYFMLEWRLLAISVILLNRIGAIRRN